MIRRIEWMFDDESNTLMAVTQRIDGEGSDVVWSTTDTDAPAPWLVPDLTVDE